MVNKEVKIPCIFYLYIHSKLSKRAIGKYMKLKEATTYLHEWRIPKEIRIAIIKEMETLGLVEKYNRNMLKVNLPTTDFSDVSKIYQMVGITI